MPRIIVWSLAFALAFFPALAGAQSPVRAFPPGTFQSRGAIDAAGGGGTVVVCGSGWTGPTSGLTHCWPMDAAHVSGTTIQDAIGSINGTAGANVTAGTGPSGVSGTARTYDGSTQPIVLASDPTPATQPITVATWINKTNNIGSNGDQRWICFGSTFWLSNGNNAGTPNAAAYASTETSSTTVLSSAAWHHLAVTWDGTTLKLYIDGSLDAGFNQAGTGDNCLASTDWTLGGANAGNRLWAGSQSTTVIYNRALSSSEITTLFNAK